MKEFNCTESKVPSLPENDKRAGLLFTVIIIYTSAWVIITKEGFWPKALPHYTRDLILFIPCLVFGFLYLHSLETDTVLHTAKTVESMQRFARKVLPKRQRTHDQSMYEDSEDELYEDAETDAEDSE